MANIINGFYQVNVGSNPNDGTGDSFRDCFIATNINWGVVGNTGLANTSLSFANGTISAAAGNNINFAVNGGYVNLGNAGTSIVGDSGNVKLGGGLTGQFLRTSDTTGNVYWSGGAAGSNGMVQYNQTGSFGAQSSFTYDEAIGKLSVQNVAVVDAMTVGGNLSTQNLTAGNFQFGNGIVTGNFIVLGNVTSASSTSVDIGVGVLVLANTANNLVLLDQTGFSWGNSALLGAANTPNIRFNDFGFGNIQQSVLSIYPGIWTPGLYISASNAPTASNLSPGVITFASDSQLFYQNSASAAVFSNLRADVFNSTNANISRLTANSLDIATNLSDGSATAGRLLKIRNTSSPAGNVGLQIVNQAGGSNAAWDIFSRAGNGALTLGWSADGNGSGSNIRLEISNSGNIQVPYSSSTNSFIGFGPGDATHAGMRYVKTENTLHLEANGAIDRLQLGTDGTNRVTILGNAVAATAGFVGINTENPVSPLTVTGNTGGNRIQSGLTINRTGTFGGSFTLGVDNSNNRFFIANSSVAGQGDTMLVITGNNNLGLNIENPRANVHISSTASAPANLLVQTPGGADLTLTSYSGYGAVGTANNFPLVFQVNGVNVMTLATTGAVSTSGNISGGYILGNGAFLTGIAESFSYSNANVANYLSSLNQVKIGNYAGGLFQSTGAIAVGEFAGYVVQGFNGIAIGNLAAYNIQGSDSIAIGNTAAGTYQGLKSIAIGDQAALESQGNNAIAIGGNAAANVQGDYSIAIGREAGGYYQGIGAIAVGELAGYVLQSNYAVAIGDSAGCNFQGDNSIAIGFRAGEGTATSFSGGQQQDCIAIGTEAGHQFQGNVSIAIGWHAGQEGQDTSTIAIGTSAGWYEQYSDAIAIGRTAGAITQGSNAISIGLLAGHQSQSIGAVAIGAESGEFRQGVNSVAIGNGAAMFDQGSNAVAIGYRAGLNNQSNRAIAIGNGAGAYGQGVDSIAIGNLAGHGNQSNNSIVINATGSNLTPTIANSFYVAPIRNANTSGNVLFYDASTKEITYGLAPSVAGNITTTGNISGNYILGNGSALTGIFPGSVGEKGSVIFVATANGGSFGYGSLAAGSSLRAVGVMIPSGVNYSTYNLTASGSIVIGGVTFTNNWPLHGAKIIFTGVSLSGTWLSMGSIDLTSFNYDGVSLSQLSAYQPIQMAMRIA